MPNEFPNMFNIIQNCAELGNEEKVMAYIEGMFQVL